MGYTSEIEARPTFPYNDDENNNNNNNDITLRLLVDCECEA